MTESTAFPYRSGYEQPERADGWQPSSVTVPAVRADGSVIAQADAAFAHAKTAFEKHVDSVKPRRDNYSTEGFSAQLSAFADTAAGRGVTGALESVAQRRDEAAANVDSVRQGLTREGDAAEELRATRTWDRARRILDAADVGAVNAIASDLISKAQPIEIGTLAREIEPYLQSRGVQQMDWFDTALAAVVPELARAREQLTLADQAYAIARHNHEVLTRGFKEGRPPSALVDMRTKYDPDA